MSLRGRLRSCNPGARSVDTNGLYLEQPDLNVEASVFLPASQTLSERHASQQSSLRGRLQYYNPGVRSADTNGLYLEHFPINVRPTSRGTSALSLPERQAEQLAQLRGRLRPSLPRNSGSSA